MSRRRTEICTPRPSGRPTSDWMAESDRQRPASNTACGDGVRSSAMFKINRGAAAAVVVGYVADTSHGRARSSASYRLDVASWARPSVRPSPATSAQGQVWPSWPAIDGQLTTSSARLPIHTPAKRRPRLPQLASQRQWEFHQRDHTAIESSNTQRLPWRASRPVEFISIESVIAAEVALETGLPRCYGVFSGLGHCVQYAIIDAVSGKLVFRRDVAGAGFGHRITSATEANAFDVVRMRGHRLNSLREGWSDRG